MSDVDEPVLTLEEIDRDGALAETAEAAFGTSRSEFFRKAALSGGGLLGASALFGGLASKASAAGTGHPADDFVIANFALTLEYLEASFYVEAVRFGVRRPSRLRSLAIVVRNHELAHVRALRATIKAKGGTPVASPKFNFGNATRNAALFHSTAIVLEDVGVTAYGGQAARINDPGILLAAAQILAVEARHAAAFRQLKGLSPAPLAFNPLKTAAQVKATVLSTHFVVGAAPGLG